MPTIFPSTLSTFSLGPPFYHLSNTTPLTFVWATNDLLGTNRARGLHLPPLASTIRTVINFKADNHVARFSFFIVFSPTCFSLNLRYSTKILSGLLLLSRLVYSLSNIYRLY